MMERVEPESAFGTDEVLISVIVPVYNSVSYLHETLNSIVKQTYKKLEIIVIDDCSDDGSEFICDHFATIDERISVIHHSQNMGLSVARNTGLASINGQFVMFLDSDDVFHEDAIRLMYNIMVRECVDVVLCNSKNQRLDGDLSDSWWAIKDHYSVSGKLNKKECMHALISGQISVTAWGKMYRAIVWQNVRFPDGHVYEDLYCIFDILERIKAAYVTDEVLILHRIRNNSITSSSSLRKLQDYLLAHERYAKFIKTNTPQLFTEKMCQKTQYPDVSTLISFVVKSDKGKEREHIDACIANYLQNINSAKGYRLGIGTRIIFWLLREYPNSFRRAYPVYCVLKHR